MFIEPRFRKLLFEVADCIGGISSSELSLILDLADANRAKELSFPDKWIYRQREYRFLHACHNTTSQRNACRLWDWADNQDNPELYWRMMLDILPWAFYDKSSSNNLRRA